MSFGFFTFTLGRMRSRRLFRTFVKYYLVGVVVLVLDIMYGYNVSSSYAMYGYDV